MNTDRVVSDKTSDRIAIAGLTNEQKLWRAK